MQWGILRSVQWDVRLIRVAVYLLLVRERSTFVSVAPDAVSLPHTVNMICHSLFIHFTFTLLSLEIH